MNLIYTLLITVSLSISAFAETREFVVSDSATERFGALTQKKNDADKMEKLNNLAKEAESFGVHHGFNRSDFVVAIDASTEKIYLDLKDEMCAYHPAETHLNDGLRLVPVDAYLECVPK